MKFSLIRYFKCADFDFKVKNKFYETFAMR